MPSVARLKQIEARELELKQKLLGFKKMERDYRQNNLIEFFNRPKDEGGMPANPLQVEILEAWDNPLYKELLYGGANQIGKTTILVIIAFSVMFGRWPWSDERIYFPHNKPRKLRLVGQDWEKHVKAVLVPELKKWWPKNRKLKTKKNNNGVDYWWEDVKTDSTLEIMSNLQASELHEGWRGDFVGYDEPPTRDIRVANSRGLIKRKGRELFAMTLLKEAWIHRDIIKKVDKDGKPDRRVFSVNGDIWANVGFGLDEEGVDDFMSKLKDEEIQARIHGIPAYMSGVIYSAFNRSLRPKGHMVERFKVPTNWIVDIALDIHPREKQAVLFVATNENGWRYVIDEMWDYGDGNAIADEILRRIKQNVYRVGTVIIDPLSKSTGEAQRGQDEDSTFHKIQRKLWQHDIPLQVASKDQRSGILATKDHLEGPNKEPSLFVFEDCIRFLYEIEGWMWDEKTGKPKDKDDHMMENLYRLLLLDTKYVDPDDEWDEEEGEQSKKEVNAVTGY